MFKIFTIMRIACELTFIICIVFRQAVVIVVVAVIISVFITESDAEK